MKNLQEEAVERAYEQLRSTVPDFCGCDMCRDDVLVYVLNRLTPRYVSQRTGEVLTKLSLGSDQPKADISVLLLEALRRVRSDPRPGHTRADKSPGNMKPG